MFVNPKLAIDNGWLKFPEWMNDEQKSKCVQPNAIDITADKAFRLDFATSMVLSENSKTMRKVFELKAVEVNVNDKNYELYWEIPTGCVDIMSDFFVKIPEGVAALLIVRSTLNRNGLFVTSGIYDSGFENYIGLVLHNDGPKALLSPHTRIAQIAFIKSEISGIMYQGNYNKNKGNHWSTT